MDKFKMRKLCMEILKNAMEGNSIDGYKFPANYIAKCSIELSEAIAQVGIEKEEIKEIEQKIKDLEN